MSLELKAAICPLHEGQLTEKEVNMREAAKLSPRLIVPLGVLGQV